MSVHSLTTIFFFIRKRTIEIPTLAKSIPYLKASGGCPLIWGQVMVHRGDGVSYSKTGAFQLSNATASDSAAAG